MSLISKQTLLHNPLNNRLEHALTLRAGQLDWAIVKEGTKSSPSGSSAELESILWIRGPATIMEAGKEMKSLAAGQIPKPMSHPWW